MLTTQPKVTARLILLLLGLVGCIILSLGLGQQYGQIRFDRFWVSSTDLLTSTLVWQWRAPRVLTAVIIGACLSVSGLVFQKVMQNPLADPFLLGISGGAGLAVVLLRALMTSYGKVEAWWMTPLAAFTGAGLVMFLVLLTGAGFSKAPSSATKRSIALRLILAGVAINALCAAVMGLLLAFFDPFRLKTTAVWLTGGIGFVRWIDLGFSTVLAVLLIFFLRARAYQLNTLAVGQEGVLALGLNPQRLTLMGCIAASFLAALAVSLAGLVGYVGLIVPNVIRLLVGQDLRRTLFLSAISGAILLLVADDVARLAVTAEELPVGVVTALLGCPFLMIVLQRELRHG